MPSMVRRSLLLQLVSVYLLFVLIVLAGGLLVNTIIEQHLSNDVQASNQALGLEIALETGLQLSDAEHAVVALGSLVSQAHTPEEIHTLLGAFKAARSDVNFVYWLDPLVGILMDSAPVSPHILGSEFEPPEVVPQ